MEFLIIMILIVFQKIQGELLKNPKPRHNTRITARLTVKGSKCIFPFTYRGVDYWDCAPGVTQLSTWCAITLKDVHGHIVEDWEICADIAVRDDKICKSFVLDDCQSKGIKKACPHLCSTVTDAKICKILDLSDCKSKGIEKACPQMCLAVTDNKICKTLNLDDCKSKGIEKACPQMCSAVMCDPECINGKCTGPNECTCNDKWSGDRCDKRICDNGWTGDRCDEPVCGYGCVNGHCISPGHCSCRNGWVGRHCDLRKCPSDGFFRLSMSTQCFKLYHDKTVTWYTAKAICGNSGLVLAEPSPAITVQLQSYLNDTYEPHTNNIGCNYWLGGRGDGSHVTWQRQGTIVAPGGNLWNPHSVNRGVTTNHCLAMQGHCLHGAHQDLAGRPLWSAKCDGNKFHPLCERIFN